MTIKDINIKQSFGQQQKDQEYYASALSKTITQNVTYSRISIPRYIIPSHKQYDSLHTSHISTTISSLGYNRTWPSAFNFGCHKYSSLQLKDIQTEATIGKINGIRSLLQKNKSAKAVHILIAWYKHASGITYPILE